MDLSDPRAEVSVAQTRVLIFGASPILTDFTLRALEFCGVDCDYQRADDAVRRAGSDFFILENEAAPAAAAFKPNILFLPLGAEAGAVNEILTSISAGGMLFFNADLGPDLVAGGDFYRKMPYRASTLHFKDERPYFQSDFGLLPMHTADKILLNHVESLLQLCQYLGARAEDLYEFLLGFEA